MFGDDGRKISAGDRVVYIGCAHDEPCSEMVRPCSVDVYGAMDAVVIRKDRRLVCKLDCGDYELFDWLELDTVDAVAERAAKAAAL